MQVSTSSYSGVTSGRQENYGLRKLPSVRKRMERTSCIGRVWIFLLLGVILIILGLVVVGVYFNVHSITSSTDYTEMVPSYINAALKINEGALIGAGALIGMNTIIGAGLFNIPLFWKRMKVMVFTTVIVSVVAGLFTGITAVVTATHILQPIRSFTRCRFYQSQQLCQCFSPYFRDGLDIQYLENEETKYDFEDTSNCSVIQDTLTQLLLTLITVYGIAFLLCIGAAIVALLVLRIETNKRRFCEAEDYEEVYSVTDTSQNQSDTEIEGATEVVTSSASHVTPAANPGTTTLSHVMKSANQPQEQNVSLKPVDIYPQKTPLTSRIKNQSSSDTLNSDKFRSSRRNSKSKKAKEQDTSNHRNSLTFAKRLSRSCDSLDTSGQGESQTPDFNTSQSEGKQVGKLKAHRRKGRRAVTLHNLDTKQLMLILNLQMRYLEETKQYHSQKDLKNLTSTRRAITPQPLSHQPKIPQNVRSHTPQPYRRQNGEISQPERDFYAQIKALYESNLRKGGQGVGTDIYVNNQFDHKVPQNTNTAPPHREKHNPYIYGQRGHSADSVLDSIHYVTYSDNMLSLKGPKTKSRATVQDYILPPQPLHRHNKNTLPPQPIRRQKSADQSLPMEPVHRGKSAFHIVDCARNTSRSSSVSSDQSEPVNPVTVSKQTPRKTRSDYAEIAIRDNFQLNQNPYMLKNTQPQIVATEQKMPCKLSDVSSKSIKSYVSSEIPPPYTGPPSYFEFLSSCDTSGTSTSSSNQEEIYSRPVRRNVGQSSANDKYCFEIESKNLLTSERDKNYNIRQPNLDSVYGYTESLNDVQNCHGDIKFREVRGEGRSSEYHTKNTQKRELIRESVYSTPSKSKVKQCVVPEDYYTALQKTSRHTPFYANAEHVEKANKLVKHIGGQNRDKTVSSPIPNSANYRVKHDNIISTSHEGKFDGYVYPEKNQITSDPKYHEYEDIYDPPETDEPILISHKELNEMRQLEKKRNGHDWNDRSTACISKGSPKKNKIKPYTPTYPDHNRHITDIQKPANENKKIPNQPVDNPRYNIPTVVVTDGESVEDEVFTNGNVNSVHENGALNSENKDVGVSHGVRSVPRGENFVRKNHELTSQIADEKYSAYCLTGQSTSHEASESARNLAVQNEDAVQMAEHSTNQNGASYRTNHVTRLATQSSESDHVPEGTDESSEDLVDTEDMAGNSSEDECAETDV